MAQEHNKRTIPNLKSWWRRNKDELVKLCEDYGIKLEGKPPYRNLTKTDIRLTAEAFFGVVDGEEESGRVESQKAELSYQSTDSEELEESVEESVEVKKKVPPTTLPKTLASLKIGDLIRSQSEHSSPSTPSRRPPPPSANSLRGKGRGTRMSSQSPVMRPGVEALSAGASGMAPGSMEELMQAQMNQIQQLIANGNDKLENALGNRYTAGMGALREELLLYVGEHTANKKDMDKLAERFAESEVNNQRSMKALEDASARDREESSANYEKLRREVDEVKLALQNANQGPALNENQVASSVMSYMAMHEATRKNMVIMGIPELPDPEDTIKVVIADLRRFFDSCIGMPFDRVVREATRLGRKKEGVRAQPRMCKVCFTGVQYRDAVLSAAMRDTKRRIDEWNAWKAQYPTTWEEDHEDKPPFRRYFPDVPLTTRAKRQELTEVVQLVSFAGPVTAPGQEQLILSTMGNGDAKLLLAVKEHDGNWSSDMSGVRAEQYAAKVLIRFAAGKKWITRATRAYTRAGAYLPDVFPESLKGRLTPWITRVAQSSIGLRAAHTGREDRLGQGQGEGRIRMEGLEIQGGGVGAEGVDDDYFLEADMTNEGRHNRTDT